MSKRAHRAEGSPLSVKSQRLLQSHRLDEAFEAGAALVAVGRIYHLNSGERATLAFSRDDQEQTLVGYAVDRGGWTMVESEPFSARALGYYQRWLKRHGRPES
jgi:hypothetical protein